MLQNSPKTKSLRRRQLMQIFQTPKGEMAAKTSGED